ncbi:MAG: hypothetical protein R6X33_13990 [Candidatus Brocadiia bacterium]
MTKNKYTSADAQKDLDKILKILPKAFARRRGWRNEPNRHAMSAMGIKTTAKGLNKWERAENYMGKDYSDYYVAYSKSRDASPLEKSNWDAFLKELRDEDGVEIVRFNHWAVGWVEVILIHEDAEEALNKAEDLSNEMAQYPLLDEEDYYSRLYEGALNNIKWEGNVDEEEAKKIYDYLSTYNDREIEARDGKAPYPSKEAIREAQIYFEVNDYSFPKGIDKESAVEHVMERMTDYEVEDVLDGDRTIKEVIDDMGIRFSQYHPSQTRLGVD